MDSATLDLRPKNLKPGEIHVWQIRLDRDHGHVKTMSRKLSADELRRAGNYRFVADRDRFIIARATLRTILGSYLGIEAGHIRFGYNKFGKPFIEMNCEHIGFNVTHSQGTALFAITSGRSVGIDVEFVDDSFPFAKVARHIFPPAEYSKLRDLDPDLQIEAFFEYWTRREAYIKAVGTGFSGDGEAFSKENIPGWATADLQISGEYRAAVAAKGEITAIRHYPRDFEQLIGVSNS